VTTFELPPLVDQAERLIELGVPDWISLEKAQLRALAGANGESTGLLVLPQVNPLQLAELMEHRNKSGFVVEDLQDLPSFMPFNVEVPQGQAYLVSGLERGDEYSNETPNETYPKLAARQRSPITITEGIFWILQRPDVLARNKCFMTTGSRLRKTRRNLDARTPALWISNGTGRDGKERRDAPPKSAGAGPATGTPGSASHRPLAAKSSNAHSRAG